MNLKECFESFLKEYGVFEKFVYNCDRGHIPYSNNNDWYWDCLNPYLLLRMAFIWDETLEGNAFWLKLHNNWRFYLNSKLPEDKAKYYRKLYSEPSDQAFDNSSLNDGSLKDGSYYCEHFITMFKVENGVNKMCKGCKIRCPHSLIKEEKDYLVGPLSKTTLKDRMSEAVSLIKKGKISHINKFKKRFD